MANSISLFKKYVPMLDEVYKQASLTSILDGAADLVREGANANEMVIPMLDMQGLGDYSRNSGYVSGDVTLTYETVACNFDRGRRFQVDNVDNMETFGLAFGRLAGEFLRTKVVPEVDAFRMATYAQEPNIGTVTAAVLSSGTAVIQALRVCADAMDNAEVPMDQRYLFIANTLKGMIDDLDTTKSKAVLNRFAGVIAMPQSRFYTKITQYDGSTQSDNDATNPTPDQRVGGYVKAADGKDINFMCIHKPAVIQFPKHVVPRVFTPEQNQNADAYLFTYRNLGIADVYQNKRAGIYLHKNAT